MIGRGPSPMALGPYPFRALGFSFQGLKGDLQTPWSELEVVHRLDALHWTGPKSDSFNIAGVIFDESFGGQASLDGIKGAASAGIPMMLVTGAGGVGGFHVCFGVAEDKSVVRRDGLAARNAYQITLRRLGAGGIASAAGAIVSLF